MKPATECQPASLKPLNDEAQCPELNEYGRQLDEHDFHASQGDVQHEMGRTSPHTVCAVPHSE